MDVSDLLGTHARQFEERHLHPIVVGRGSRFHLDPPQGDHVRPICSSLWRRAAEPRPSVRHCRGACAAVQWVSSCALPLHGLSAALDFCILWEAAPTSQAREIIPAQKTEAASDRSASVSAQRTKVAMPTRIPAKLLWPFGSLALPVAG
jgi:hypothetical protein